MDSLMDGLRTGFDSSDGMDAIIELLQKKNEELQAIKAEKEAKKAKRSKKKDAVEALTPEPAKPVVNPYVDTTENYMALAVAILAPDIVEKDKDGNPIMESVTDEKGNLVMEDETDKDGNPIMEVETDENGNVVYTVESGAMVPKQKVKQKVKTRIKKRDVSVDDALHMMGLDRKNNKNKDTDEVE